MINSFLINFEKYKVIIFTFLLINNILCTFYCYIKYRKKDHKQIYFRYYTYGCFLLSMGVFLYLIKWFTKSIIDNIDKNIIFYYKLPLIIVIVGIMILIVGGYKERSRGGKKCNEQLPQP